MLNYKNTGVLIVATIALVSCGNEATPESSVPKKEQQEVLTEKKDTLQESEAIVKWYAGESPTDEEKRQLMIDFQSGEKGFDFYAVFTEPFWHLYFFGNEVLVYTFESEIPEVVPLEYPFSDSEEEQALSFMLDGQFWQLKVKKEEGSDGMSEITYPYSVKLDQLEGGGATKMMRGE